MFSGHDYGKFFREEMRLALAANSGGIHEAIGAAVALDYGIHGVARGAGHGRNNRAIGAGEAIEQCGFSDVGPADDGDLNCVERSFGGAHRRGVRRRFRGSRAWRHRGNRRDRCRARRRRERRRLRARRTARRAVPARSCPTLFAAMRRGLPVLRSRRASSASSGVRPARASTTRTRRAAAFDGHFCLAQNFARDLGFVIGDESAGVHNFEVAIAPGGGAVDAIAGDAGLVGDDGAARAGEAVEERGLADVGPADNDQQRQRRWQGWDGCAHQSGEGESPALQCTAIGAIPCG